MRENHLAICIVLILGMIFGVAFYQAAHGQERMDGTEWECRALPPEGTKFKNDMEAIAVHEDRNESEKSAVWLCNRLFKTNGCKIDYCRKVKRIIK